MILYKNKKDRQQNFVGGFFIQIPFLQFGSFF